MNRTNPQRPVEREDKEKKHARREKIHMNQKEH